MGSLERNAPDFQTALIQAANLGYLPEHVEYEPTGATGGQWRTTEGTGQLQGVKGAGFAPDLATAAEAANLFARNANLLTAPPLVRRIFGALLPRSSHLITTYHSFPGGVIWMAHEVPEVE